MILSYNSFVPILKGNNFIATNATVIGNVIVGENSSIWFGAVVRADIDKIEIGSNTNIQDNVVIHIDKGKPTIIGDEVTIGHNAIIHGAKLGNRTLIGMGAIILDGAQIGEGSIVAAGSVVRPNIIIPPRCLVAGVPAEIKRNTTDKELEAIIESAKNYVELAKIYINSI